jgi:bifunctional enzyme CysN/CysC
MDDPLTDGETLRVVVFEGAGDGAREACRALAQIPATRRYRLHAAGEGPAQTRAIVAAAATADVAIVATGAQDEHLRQARRGMQFVALAGVRHVILAVTGSGAGSDGSSTFARIEEAQRGFGARLGLATIACVPVERAPRHADAAGPRSPAWYRGPTVSELLDLVPPRRGSTLRAFRMLVEAVNLSPSGTHEYRGTIVSGTVIQGDRVVLQPAGSEFRVVHAVIADGAVPEAEAGSAGTLTLAGDDASGNDGPRSDGQVELISAAGDAAPVADQFEASVIWMHDAPLLHGRSYRMTIGAAEVNATVAPLKYRIDGDTLEHVASRSLARDEIGICALELDRPVAFEPHAVDRRLGAFLLSDPRTGETAGAGQLRFALHRAQNIRWHPFDVDKAARAALKSQNACVLWFTGLPSAGKSTIANLLERKLHARGRHTYLLDGDNVRKGLNKDLGFTAADRVENIRRIAEVAAFMADAGLIVIAAFISPFRAERRMARRLLPEGEFVEVFIDTPLAVAEGRDPKGLYRKARRGELANFTGIDSPYEPPEHPEIRIDGAQVAPAVAADRIVAELERRGIVGT